MANTGLPSNQWEVAAGPALSVDIRTWTYRATLLLGAGTPTLGPTSLPSSRWEPAPAPERPRNLLEWVQNPLTLRSIVNFPSGKQSIDRPPERELHPRTLRTWTWSYNRLLIGKDILPPGDQQTARQLTRPFPVFLRTWTDHNPLLPQTTAQAPFNQTHWPLPQKHYVDSFDNTWTWSYNLNLIGQDALPVGDRITDRPPAVTWYQTWALNLLQGTLTPSAAPFSQDDWPNPVQPSRLQQSWTFSFPLDLIGQDALPVGTAHYDRPPTLSWYQSWAANLLQSTLTPTLVPFVQDDWPLPRAPTPLPQSWAASFPLTLIGQDSFPVGEVVYDLAPRGPAPIQQGWAFTFNPNLRGQDAMVVGEAIFDRPPLGPKPIDQTWVLPLNLNLYGKDFLFAGDIIYDRPSLAQQPIQQTWTFTFNPNLIGQDALPPGDQRTERPPTIDWRLGWTQNLLQSTLTPQFALPFNQYDWPNPIRFSHRRSWEFSFNLDLIGQDSFPPGGRVTDRPPPLDWRRDWTQNLLLSTLAPKVTPFNQTDWPINAGPVLPQRGWTFTFNPNLIGQDQLPPGKAITDRPQPVDWRRDWVQNLQQSTLTPRPVGATLFDRPPPVDWYRTLAVNLLQTTLAPTVAATPFNQFDWPLPRGPLQPSLGLAASFNLNLIGQDQLPVGERVYDLAPRGVLATDARSWVANTSLALSASLGVPVGVQITDLAPRAPSPAGPTTAFSFNPNLVGQDRFPPGKTLFDRPPPNDWRRDWAFRLPPDVLAFVNLPFNQKDWPLRPGPLQPDRSFAFSRFNGLAGQDQLPIGEVIFALPPRGPLPSDFRSWAGGNQITLLPPAGARTMFRTYIFG